MTENQKNYVDGYISGLVNNDDCDFCVIDGIEERGAEYVVPIEAMDDTDTSSQVVSLSERINAMLEETGIPYVADVNIEIVLTPMKGGKR